jgi:hypothetical protein
VTDHLAHQGFELRVIDFHGGLLSFPNESLVFPVAGARKAWRARGWSGAERLHPTTSASAACARTYARILTALDERASDKLESLLFGPFESRLLSKPAVKSATSNRAA